MAFYCLNGFVLIGFLSSNTEFAAGSEAVRAVTVAAVSPCGSELTEGFLFYPAFCSGVVADCISEVFRDTLAGFQTKIISLRNVN